MSKKVSYTSSRRQKVKAALISAYGGVCQLCGYNKCQSSLVFHHLDPTEKDFTISQWKGFDFDRIISEAKKCVLVCANCHGELHESIRLEKFDPIENSVTLIHCNFDSSVFNDTYSSITLTKRKLSCVCGKPKKLFDRWCSDDCISRIGIRGYKSIDINLVNVMLDKGMTYRSIAKTVGVSYWTLKRRLGSNWK